MNKVRREREVTCQRIGEDNVRTPFACKQVVEIEERDEDGISYTSVHHNGEILTMDLENLMSLYALIGGAIGEYYHKTSTQFTKIDIKQALERGDLRTSTFPNSEIGYHIS